MIFRHFKGAFLAPLDEFRAIGAVEKQVGRTPAGEDSAEGVLSFASWSRWLQWGGSAASAIIAV